MLKAHPLISNLLLIASLFILNVRLGGAKKTPLEHNYVVCFDAFGCRGLHHEKPLLTGVLSPIPSLKINSTDDY